MDRNGQRVCITYTASTPDTLLHLVLCYTLKLNQITLLVATRTHKLLQCNGVRLACCNISACLKILMQCSAKPDGTTKAALLECLVDDLLGQCSASLHVAASQEVNSMG